jgi:hypothetical protein
MSKLVLSRIRVGRMLEYSSKPWQIFSLSPPQWHVVRNMRVTRPAEMNSVRRADEVQLAASNYARSRLSLIETTILSDGCTVTVISNASFAWSRYRRMIFSPGEPSSALRLFANRAFSETA